MVAQPWECWLSLRRGGSTIGSDGSALGMVAQSRIVAIPWKWWFSLENCGPVSGDVNYSMNVCSALGMIVNVQ
jgi:hypothetical protein